MSGLFMLLSFCDVEGRIASKDVYFITGTGILAIFLAAQ
jgi:hypothetical protein